MTDDRNKTRNVVAILMRKNHVRDARTSAVVLVDVIDDPLPSVRVSSVGNVDVVTKSGRAVANAYGVAITVADRKKVYFVSHARTPLL